MKKCGDGKMVRGPLIKFFLKKKTNKQTNQTKKLTNNKKNLRMSPFVVSLEFGLKIKLPKGG